MPATFAKLSLLWLLGQSWSAIVYCSDAQGAKISPALVIVSGIFATDHAVTSVIVIQLNKWIGVYIEVLKITKVIKTSELYAHFDIIIKNVSLCEIKIN